METRQTARPVPSLLKLYGFFFFFFPFFRQKVSVQNCKLSCTTSYRKHRKRCQRDFLPSWGPRRSLRTPAWTFLLSEDFFHLICVFWSRRSGTLDGQEASWTTAELANWRERPLSPDQWEARLCGNGQILWRSTSWFLVGLLCLVFLELLLCLYSGVSYNHANVFTRGLLLDSHEVTLYLWHIALLCSRVFVVLSSK